MLAMCWENIDFANNEINVREAVSYRNGMPRLGLPKSKAGIRKIPLDFRLKALLIPQRQISGFVIGESLTPLAEKAFQRRWRRIAETIDLHGATPHVFRHTYLSIAVAAGIDHKTVQVIAGHADIETTLEACLMHGKRTQKKQDKTFMQWGENSILCRKCAVQEPSKPYKSTVSALFLFRTCAETSSKHKNTHFTNENYHSSTKTDTLQALDKQGNNRYNTSCTRP